MTVQQATTVPRVRFHLTRLNPFGVLATCIGSGRLEDVSTVEWEQLVSEHGVVVARGLDPVSITELEAYGRRIGELLEWPFGYVLDLKVAENAQNYLFTRDRVPFHWDGVFARQDPHYLFFQCVQAPGQGGESLFSDTTRVWKRASPEDQEWLSGCVCRYYQKRTAHYGGDVTTGLIRKHPITGEPTIRYTEPVMGVGGNAPELVGADATETQRLADYLARALYEPAVCLSHRWASGDFVLFDNHRMLHGRHAFGSTCDRHLQRVHVL